MAEGFVSLEKRFGVDPARRIDLPADPKDEAAMAAVWKRLGAPEASDAYKFEFQGEPSEADQALLKGFQDRAFALHMPTQMAEGVLQFWNEQLQAATAARTAALEKAQADGLAALKQEWGNAFEQRSQEVGRALLKYGTPDLAKAMEGGMGNYAPLAIALGRMIERMAEPGDGAGTPGARTGNISLTPAQAMGEVRKLDSHPALHDARHPEHNAIVEQRRQLLRQANPAPAGAS